MDGYFSRIYGLSAQIQGDSYVTDLANSQSGSSIHAGAGYCSATGRLFEEVLASESRNDLLQLSLANRPALPVATMPCKGGGAGKAVDS